MVYPFLPQSKVLERPLGAYPLVIYILVKLYIKDEYKNTIEDRKTTTNKPATSKSPTSKATTENDKTTVKSTTVSTTPTSKQTTTTSTTIRKE